MAAAHTCRMLPKLHELIEDYAEALLIVDYGVLWVVASAPPRIVQLSSITSRNASKKDLSFARIQWLLLLYLLLQFLRRNKPIQRARGGMIVVLNGFPGTGKHTILQRLRELLPADISSCLVDNHLLIDPAQALFPDRSDDHHTLRRRIRDAVFPCIGKLAREGHVVLMTACLAADNDRDAAFFREHLALVSGTDVPLYWVSTSCDKEHLMERARSDERVRSSKTKLTDPIILEGLVNAHRLLEPGELSGGLTNLVIGSLDTNGEVDDSARQLMEMVGLARAVEAE